MGLLRSWRRGGVVCVVDAAAAVVDAASRMVAAVVKFMVDAFAVDRVVCSANQLMCFSLLRQKLLS